MNKLELDFYSVLDDALEARHIRVVENGDYTVAELLPGVFELVTEEHAYRLSGLPEILDQFDAAEIWEPGKFTHTEWTQLEDGRWFTCFMKA